VTALGWGASVARCERVPGAGAPCRGLVASAGLGSAEQDVCSAFGLTSLSPCPKRTHNWVIKVTAML